MARILVLGVKVPFTLGGQDALVNSLVRELRNRGHEADSVELPLSAETKEELLAQAAVWRTLNLDRFVGKDVDLIIATKFPCYFARHKKKSIWLVHQHRFAYELIGGRFSDFSDTAEDEAVRQLMYESDVQALGESSFVSCISKNVADRLEAFNGISSKVLYPPLPLGNRYRNEAPEPYILSVGRICYIKRLDYLVRAMPMVQHPVTVKVVGTPDDPTIMDYIHNEIERHHLWDRIEFLGRVSDDELLSLYAKSLAVYYAPFDEDYGYVTLEAFASGKPVIAATDSGGVLEFVTHEETGLVAQPTVESIADACNRLYRENELTERLSKNARAHVEKLGLLEIGWDDVIDGLLSPIE